MKHVNASPHSLHFILRDPANRPQVFRVAPWAEVDVPDEFCVRGTWGGRTHPSALDNTAPHLVIATDVDEIERRRRDYANPPPPPPVPAEHDSVPPPPPPARPAMPPRAAQKG